MKITLGSVVLNKKSKQIYLIGTVLPNKVACLNASNHRFVGWMNNEAIEDKNLWEEIANIETKALHLSMGIYEKLIQSV